MKCISSHKAGYVLFLILLLLVAACSQVDQFPDDVQKEVFPANAIEEKNNLRGPEPTPTATSVTTNASVTVTPPEVALFLPDMGLAPEIENEIWLNSEPLRLGDLRGKVVMVEFWTFGCINCKRVLPYLNEWQARYAGDDFVIISVHYPEFGYEEKIENVRAAVQEQAIEFAVAIDNDGQTWRAYRQRYWPTRYLIDKTGHIRYKHIGEGAYQETAAAIEQLMAELTP